MLNTEKTIQKKTDLSFIVPFCLSQSGGAVEYIERTSVEGVRLPPQKCPGYDNKQSDGELLFMLDLQGMWSASSLPLFQVHSAPEW